MIKGYCKKHYNNKCLAIVMGVSCFQQILKKTSDLSLKFGYFHFSMGSSTLTASWLPIFVPFEPS